jgi:hypothetical protein
MGEVIVSKGMTKIPEDLPVHERYIPLSRSRSTKTIRRQNEWRVATPMEGDSTPSSRFSVTTIESVEDKWEFALAEKAKRMKPFLGVFKRMQHKHL